MLNRNHTQLPTLVPPLPKVLVDQNQLAETVGMINYLENPYTPRYSLAELEDILASFAKYLDRNETAIIETGYPEEVFLDSPWLRSSRSLLYPTKRPGA